MTDIFSTGQRERAAKRILRILQVRDIPRPKAVLKLTQPVKIQKQNGKIVEMEAIYDRSNDASSFIKELVKEENFPVEVDGNYLTRTDLQEKEKPGGEPA